VQAGAQADPAKVAALIRQRDTLDPFVLAARIDEQLQRVYALAAHRAPAAPSMAGGRVAAAKNASATLPPRSKSGGPSVTLIAARRGAVR